MTSPPLIAVAPHLDDVALSAASEVTGWGGPRMIVSVFAGDPPGPISATAAAFHDSCGLHDDAMHHRRREDRAACAALECEPLHLGFPEALYRTTAAGDPVVATDYKLFDGAADAEPGVVAEVAAALGTVAASHPGAYWLVPLGNGLHRDHAIVRRAVESLHRPAVGYYEDQPYGWWGRPVGPPPPADYVRQCRVLDGRTWKTKLHALECHASQMRMLWGAAWRERIEDEHAREGAEPVEALWFGG
jgi:LmbE family N-acetylglucosaminyl deacetylase